MSAALAGIHESAQIRAHSAVILQEAEFFQIVKTVVNFKEHMLDAFQHTFEHDRSDKSVAEEYVSPVVKAVDRSFVAAVGISDIACNTVTIKGFGDMEL